MYLKKEVWYNITIKDVLLLLINYHIFMFKKIVSLSLVVGMFIFNFGLISPHVATAASLTVFSDTVSNLTTGVKAGHVIKFTTPTGITSGKTIVLTFDNSTSTTGVVFSDVTVTAPGAITVVAGAPGTTNWGFVNTSSTVLTFTLGSSASVAPGAIVTITFNGLNKITNGTAGTTTLRLTGTMADSGTLSMPIVTNGVVAVTAEVLSAISFTVSTNSINFGTLSSSAPRYANPSTGSATDVTAFTMTAGTNASTGYTLSVEGDTLKSGTTNTITANATNVASTAGSEQFGLRMDATGSGVVSAPYTDAGFAYTGAVGVPATVATSAGASAATSYAVHYIANISALTESGNYSTAHTYVATGNF